MHRSTKFQAPPNVVDFLLSGEGFYAPGHCDLDLWLTDPKTNRDHLSVMSKKPMHRSAKFKTPPNVVDFLLSGEGLWRGSPVVFSRSDCHLTIES